MVGAMGLTARVQLLLGRAVLPRARAAAKPRLAATPPRAMASPFEDQKKEAAKRALMAALEGKKDILKENGDREAKEAARRKAAGGGGKGGAGGGGGGGGGGDWGGSADDGRRKKESGATTLQTFAIVIGGVRRPLSSLGTLLGCAACVGRANLPRPLSRVAQPRGLARSQTQLLLFNTWRQLFALFVNIIFMIFRCVGASGARC